MRYLFITISFILTFCKASGQSTFVRFETNKGSIVVMLYDKTPKHRNMFLNMIQKGAYKNAEFNRVIKAFVSQGGELDDTILNREKRQPNKPVSRFPAEIIPGIFHKKGALGAGRDDNPQKASYFTQLYFVVGRKQTDEQLDAIELKKKRKFSLTERETYKAIGGTPHLDGDYTVFGEIISGMDVGDAINAVETNKDDVPLSSQVFNPVVLSKQESIKLRALMKR